MAYIIAQIFGLLSALCCFIGPFFEKKWQMLVNSAIANIFNALNFFLLGEVGSGIIINFIAVLQILFSLWHVVKNTKVTFAENIIFLIAYVIFGIFGFNKLIDILPVIGAVFFMLSTFQRDEQKTRLLCLGNAAIWIIYDVLIGSSAALAQLATICTTSVAIYKYKRR